MTSALLTDRYELTMVEAALKAGTAHRDSVFEVFARRLPEGRRYGIVAGTGRFLELLADFRFGDDEVAWLREAGVVDATTADWLADALTPPTGAAERWYRDEGPIVPGQAPADLLVEMLR